MPRLQQKCVIASAGLHLLLVAILFIGPAFLASKDKSVDLPTLTFIPLKTVDALVSGGGTPNGRLPAPPPPEPEPPKPVALPAPQPQPEPEPVKPPPSDPEPSLEPSPRKARKIEISTVRVTRKPAVDTEAKRRAEEQAKEREMAQVRRQMADRIGSAMTHIQSGMSSSAKIDPNNFAGPGGGGIPYANFLQAVKSVYDNAWILPDGVTDDNATVTASVTIGRDGRVISARITRSSNNVAVDQSVRRTLERVKYAAPLPDDAKENERTVPIKFDVRAKRALG